jgi:hypothetical protein
MCPASLSRTDDSRAAFSGHSVTEHLGPFQVTSGCQQEHKRQAAAVQHHQHNGMPAQDIRLLVQVSLHHDVMLAKHPVLSPQK